MERSLFIALPAAERTRPYHEGTPLPVSDVTLEPTSNLHTISNGATVIDDERPPACPTCNKRLVILATHSVRDENGGNIRQQLWGCPKGHATATRRRGTFSPVVLLNELVG